MDLDCEFPVLARRELDDGRELSLVAMLWGNLRLCIGDGGTTYDDGWCFNAPQTAEAWQAMQTWDGQGDPPRGWYKHLGSRRLRPEGDPQREYLDGEEPLHEVGR